MSSTDRPDLVFLGATVETMTDDAGPADALAVRDGRIAFVGSSADVRHLIGSGTRVIELGGETLLPGFQDAHVHPIEGGMLSRSCDLHDLADAAACLEAIAAHATAHPDRPWITGGGWSLPAFPRGEPHRSLLDAIVPDRPALLESDDGHVGWANSKALAVGGIDRATPDPPGGRIVRDAGGEPTGTLHDYAIDLVTRHAPQATHDDLLDGLRAAQRHLHALGITGWQDAHVEPDALAAYRDAAAAGLAHGARRRGPLVAARGRTRADRGLRAQRDGSAVGRLRADSVKLMLDGILESRTALMTAPYIGHDGEAGMPFIDPDLLRRAVVELDRRGFQAHFHAIGDGAVRLALDVVQAAGEPMAPPIIGITSPTSRSSIPTTSRDSRN